MVSLKLEQTDYEGRKSQRIVEASFGEWLNYVFGGDETQRDWISDSNIPEWSLPPAVTLGFMEQTFRDASSVLTAYSDGELANGLNFLHNNSFSDTVFLLSDKMLPVESRLAAIDAIYFVYEGCFAKRCVPGLGHLNEDTDNSLNTVCYMWWDVFPFFSGSSDVREERSMSEACLAVMERALELNHDACRESVLHGLGHWELDCADRVHSIIDSFLQRHSRLRPELRRYAEAARRGCVQ